MGGTGERLPDASGLPVVEGLDGTVEVVVTGRGDGDLRVRAVIRGGRPDLAGDKPGETPAAEQRSVTFTVPADVADRIAAGAVEASVAFMQGRLKTAGDNGLVLDLLRASASPEAALWLAAAAAGGA